MSIIGSTHFVKFGEYQVVSTLTDKGGSVARWIDDMSTNFQEQIVGIDLKLHEGRPVQLQLCVDNKCLIFQIHRADYVPYELFTFLWNKKNHFVGIGTSVCHDLWVLKREYGLMVGPHVIDLIRLAVELTGDVTILTHYGERHGLKKLLKVANITVRFDRPVIRTFGVDWSKVQTYEALENIDISTSVVNWSKAELTLENIEEATVDAFASLLIGQRLIAQKVEGRYKTNFLGLHMSIVAEYKKTFDWELDELAVADSSQ